MRPFSLVPMGRPPEVADHPEDTSVDAAIRASIEATSQETWDELRQALEAVEALPADAYCTWIEADRSLPWPDYAPEVERLRDLIAASGLVVPYPWPKWSGIKRHRRGAGLDTAPVEDAVRMTTAVLRSERFGDGNIDGALQAGTLQAAVRRVLTWVESR